MIFELYNRVLSIPTLMGELKIRSIVVVATLLVMAPPPAELAIIRTL
jgi:hypothetical protein